MSICANPNCGHNDSQHALSWNPFRGQWDTSCRAYIPSRASDRCGCAAFQAEKEQAS